MKSYEARCAQDAQRGGYGNESYWDYLDQSSRDHRDYFLRDGDAATAEKMMTQTLSEALMGNEGI